MPEDLDKFKRGVETPQREQGPFEAEPTSQERTAELTSPAPKEAVAQQARRAGKVAELGGRAPLAVKEKGPEGDEETVELDQTIVDEIKRLTPEGWVKAVVAGLYPDLTPTQKEAGMKEALRQDAEAQDLEQAA